MRRSLRFRRMEGPTQTLMIVGVCGSVVAAAFGALAGAGLRVPPRIESLDQPAALMTTEDVFLASAPRMYRRGVALQKFGRQNPQRVGRNFHVILD